MLRKLGYGVATLAITVPSAVWALSVEDYTLNSYLSQPLDLEIKLSELQGLSKDDIRIRLAAPEEFEAAGIEYDVLHNSLEFDVDVAGDGTGTVRVTSKQPLNEPFISFLVEYKWPSGRLMREYNLLLDPPSYRAESTAAERATPARDSAPKQTAAAPTQQRQTPSSTRQGEGGAEHRVSSNETLWDIAARHRSDSSVSVQQMMVAIQELNPDAFINGNINLVREGAILRLPSESQVRNITTREAMSEVAAQNRQWQQMLESRGLAPEPTAKPLDGREEDVATSEERAGSSEESGRVTLVAADEALTTRDDESAKGADSTALSEDISRLERENAELADRLQELEEQLSLSEELLTLRSQQIAELEEKLRALNADSEDALDDEFLAAIEELEAEQAAMQELQEEAPVVIEALEEDASEEQEAAEDAESEEAEEDAAEAQGSADEEAQADGETEEPVTEEEASEAEEAASEESAEEAKEEATPLTPVVDPEPYEEPSFFATLLENTTLVFGVIILLLLALALLVVRSIKGRKDDEDEEVSTEADDEPIIDPFQLDEEASEPTVEELAADAQHLIDNEQYEAAVPVLRNAINQDPSQTQLRKNLLLALWKSNENAFQQEVVAVRGTNEELDAYIAELEQGDTAEDIFSLDDLESDLKQGDEVFATDASAEDRFEVDEGEDFLFDESTENELQAATEEDLFEEFDFSFDEETKESDDFAFESDDTDLSQLSLDDTEEDTSALEDFSFDSELSLTTEEEELPTLAMDEEGEASDFSLDEDLEPVSLDELSLDDASSEDDFFVESEEVSLDLSELSEEAPTLEEDVALEEASLADTMGDDLDLSELSFEDAGEDALSLDDATTSDEESEDVDALLAELEGFESPLSEEELSSELERELEQLGQQTELTEPSEEATPEPETSEAEKEATDTAADEESLATAALVDAEDEGDPVATRLNLARAFLDMGDEDIARETLMEVIAEGNEEQKATAQALLDELNA